MVETVQASSYKVSRITGRLGYDSVPVAKIVDYPLERRDYRPFAQCILCMDEDALHLRMWAFEVSPQPASALHCVLYPFARQAGPGLKITVAHGEEHAVTAACSLLRAEGEIPCDLGIATHPHNGEDLQGVYWGMSLDIPLARLEQLGGETLLQSGKHFPGNFYKTGEAPGFTHMGSYFPADFPDAPYSRRSMGEFHPTTY